MKERAKHIVYIFIWHVVKYCVSWIFPSVDDEKVCSKGGEDKGGVGEESNPPNPPGMVSLNPPNPPDMIYDIYQTTQNIAYLYVDIQIYINRVRQSNTPLPQALLEVFQHNQP